MQHSSNATLLILPVTQRLAAISQVALTQAQAAKGELDREYRDALLLGRDGTLRRIERIDIVEPWGETPGQRLLNRATGGWRISVHLSELLPLDLEQLEQRRAQCVLLNGGVHGQDSDEEPPKDRLAAAVLQAETGPRSSRLSECRPQTKRWTCCDPLSAAAIRDEGRSTRAGGRYFFEHGERPPSLTYRKGMPRRGQTTRTMKPGPGWRVWFRFGDR